MLMPIRYIPNCFLHDFYLDESDGKKTKNDMHFGQEEFYKDAYNYDQNPFIASQANLKIWVPSS